ncbi:unknown [Crocosphaera subtropica ATCC 51142]|uniref:Uncharacterized protein n=1 Tax=Crocosphaera subtropica (strain ATCC 51142 / BH68) TaxID=43989 RepID=B1WWU5_CROS5|nr:unknown [Crocosphaera subtropica ATCC 51142]
MAKEDVTSPKKILKRINNTAPKNDSNNNKNNKVIAPHFSSENQ